ncbi:MAG TPA: hypothetical protein VMY78_16675 [Solirubrobacteraceae bacterium]|nr:hypothetical protein [Solirubrobacteraceae bacterium]
MQCIRNTRLAAPAVALALAAGGAGVFAGSAGAVTGTVLNSFQRVCSLSCGAYWQVNGPYNRTVGSVCTTYNRYGTAVQRYTLPAGRKCV